MSAFRFLRQEAPRVAPDPLHLPSQRLERGAVRLGTGPDDEIPSPPERGEGGEQSGAAQLAQPSLEAVPVDGRALVARDDEPHAHERQKGSEDADLEVLGPDPLPFASYGVQLRRPCQAPLAREAEPAPLARLLLSPRPRTSTGSERSDASAPSSGGG
jgi:hypothetical protein